MAEALRQIPADAIDGSNHESISPFDAEGAGIINIILKKGKNRGFNGSLSPLQDS
jgi:hypothetical protein